MSDNEKRNKVCQVVSYVGGVGLTGNLPFERAGINCAIICIICTGLLLLAQRPGQGQFVILSLIVD